MTIVAQEIKKYKSINIKQTYPDWDETTIFAFGDTVFDEHWYYKSIIDGNQNLKPSENKESWLLTRVSDRYAQIDLRSTTVTEWNTTNAITPADDALISSFQNNRYNILALGNIHAEYVQVDVKDDTGAIIWTSKRDIYQRPLANNWFEYYFGHFGGVEVTSSIYFQLPTTSALGEIIVTVKAEAGIASVGYMVCGFADWVGNTNYSVGLGVNDNSIIEMDDWGIVTVKKRTANQTMDVDVDFPSGRIMEMNRKARKHEGTIALFVGDESSNSDYENLLMLGYIENYTTVLSNTKVTFASYSTKEVI